MVGQWGWPAPELASLADDKHSVRHANAVPSGWYEKVEDHLAAVQSLALPPQLATSTCSQGAPTIPVMDLVQGLFRSGRADVVQMLQMSQLTWTASAAFAMALPVQTGEPCWKAP